MITVEIYIRGQWMEDVAIPKLSYYNTWSMERRVTSLEEYIGATVSLLKIKYQRQLQQFHYDIFVQIPSMLNEIEFEGSELYF